MQLRATTARTVFSIAGFRLVFSTTRLVLLFLVGLASFYHSDLHSDSAGKARGRIWKTSLRKLSDFCLDEYPNSIRARLEKDGRYALATVSAYAGGGFRAPGFFPNGSSSSESNDGNDESSNDGEFKIWVYRSGKEKDTLSRLLLQDGLWEKQISDFLLGAYLPTPRPFDTIFDPTSIGYEPREADDKTRGFLDVGANLGYFSLLLASKGLLAIAVEPLPRNIGLLISSICENGFFPRAEELENGIGVGKPRVVVLPLALSDAPTGTTSTDSEECRMVLDSMNNIGNGRLVCTPSSRSSSRSMQTGGFPDLGSALFDSDEHEQRTTTDLHVTALDALFPPPRSLFPAGLKLHALKLDAEGFEQRILSGGSRTLFSNPAAADRPRFVVSEVDPELLKLASRGAGANDPTCCSATGYLARLRGVGYRLYTPAPRGRGGRFRKLRGTESVDGEGRLDVFGELELRG